MTRVRFVLPVMIFLLVGLSALAAEVTWDSDFGNTLYNAPKGWATTQNAFACGDESPPQPQGNPAPQGNPGPAPGQR